MRGQKRNAQQAERDAAKAQQTAAGAAAAADEEPRVHLRLIQLTRAAGETDDALKARAERVLARFRSGEKFAALATELSQDKRAAQGGDWGWQKKSDFKSSIGEVAFSLRRGETSALILPEGAFLLYIEDRK